MELGIPYTVQAVAEAHAEASLVLHAKRSPEAFAAIYRSHYAAISRYVYRRVGSVEIAEDVVSEVFLTALRTIGRFRYRGLPVRAWLYRIATNGVNRWARQQRLHARKQLALALASPSKAADRDSWTRDYVRTAMLTLPPRYQSVLSLHYLEGMAVEAVAKALGCRIGTVKSRLARGRDALRRCLSQRRS